MTDPSFKFQSLAFSQRVYINGLDGVYRIRSLCVMGYTHTHTHTHTYTHAYAARSSCASAASAAFLMNHSQKAQMMPQTWLWKWALKAADIIVHTGSSYITPLSSSRLSILFPSLPFIGLCFIELLRNMMHDCITTGNNAIEMWSHTD